MVTIIKRVVLYTTPFRCLRHTPSITSELPRVFWYVQELFGKLSCAENGPVLDEIRRILLHRQNIQTGVVNHVIIYDTGVVRTLFATPRHVHDADPGPARCCHGWFSMVQGYD